MFCGGKLTENMSSPEQSKESPKNTSVIKDNDNSSEINKVNNDVSATSLSADMNSGKTSSDESPKLKNKYECLQDSRW